MPFLPLEKNFHVLISLRACGPGMVSKACFAHIHEDLEGPSRCHLEFSHQGVLGGKQVASYGRVSARGRTGRRIACVSNVATLDICLAEWLFPSETTFHPSLLKADHSPPHPFLFFNFCNSFNYLLARLYLK